MYVYMHIYTYVYIYIYTHTCVYICIYIYIYIHMYVYVCMHIYIYIYIHIHIHIQFSVYIISLPHAPTLCAAPMLRGGERSDRQGIERDTMFYDVVSLYITITLIYDTGPIMKALKETHNKTYYYYYYIFY